MPANHAVGANNNPTDQGTETLLDLTHVLKQVRGLPSRLLLCVVLLVGFGSGCTMLPQRMDRPQLYNPFPQLHKIAVVPFFNQSDYPTINGADVANAYRHQLQQIRGYEVIPVGVVDQFLKQNPIAINSAPDFQLLARQLGVDAVVVGSITDFDPYYPPRMGLAVRWYAANTCLHPIPAGYGLPWGTAEEEYIPEELRYEAEFALATEQLKTQSPIPSSSYQSPTPAVGNGVIQARYQSPDHAGPSMVRNFQPGTMKTQGQMVGTPTQHVQRQQQWANGPATGSALVQTAPMSGIGGVPMNAQLPVDWPDPNGFVPAPPAPERPECLPTNQPIMELIKQFDGSDSDFTARLESYYQFRDDARFGGWQSYLERQDDFISFCCYLHISELLAGRGGAGHSRVVWRWPFVRYQP